MNRDTGIYLDRSARRIIDAEAKLHNIGTPELVEYVMRLFLNDVYQPHMTWQDKERNQRRLSDLALTMPHLPRRIYAQWGILADWNEQNQPLPF